MNELVGAAAACAAGFALVYALTPGLIKYLAGKNSTVPDLHKKGKPMVPRPGGPVIIGGMLASEAVLYLFIPSSSILAIMATTFLAFVVGLVDDRRAMGGWFKPLALAASAAPILLLGAYDTGLAFPLFGEVQIPLLYVGLVVVMISITGNTINSIDIYNGLASAFMVISGLSLSASLFIMESFASEPDYGVAAASLPLVFVALAFYKYHRRPSRIFPGDSGALAFGAMYGAVAIVGQAEVVAAVALLPAIANSFLFLSSVRRVVEYRKLKIPDVHMTEDFKLKATDDERAPVTLVRLILSWGPLSDTEVGRQILRLAAFAGSLALVTAFLMGAAI